MAVTERQYHTVQHRLSRTPPRTGLPTAHFILYRYNYKVGSHPVTSQFTTRMGAPRVFMPFIATGDLDATPSRHTATANHRAGRETVANHSADSCSGTFHHSASTQGGGGHTGPAPVHHPAAVFTVTSSGDRIPLPHSITVHCAILLNFTGT